MKGYMQLFDESGNHSIPFPDEYQEFQSIKHARAIFEHWADYIERYSDRQNAKAWLWFGEPEGLFPCDTMADRGLYIGPRGAIREERL